MSAHARGRASRRWPRSISICGCSASAPDGYHELRTIFQTISLADTLEISFTPAAQRPRSSWTIALAIPDNLVARAARLAMEAMRLTGRVEMRLTKRIPMGAGLGGGSCDAAAVLLALPVLAGRAIWICRNCAPWRQEAGQRRAVFPVWRDARRASGAARNFFPLPDAPPARALLVAPGVHVSPPRRIAT